MSHYLHVPIFGKSTFLCDSGPYLVTCPLKPLSLFIQFENNADALDIWICGALCN